MRYMIARWGYSTRIVAWQLWSELDLVVDHAIEDTLIVVNAGYLIAPHQNLGGHHAEEHGRGPLGRHPGLDPAVQHGGRDRREPALRAPRAKLAQPVSAVPSPSTVPPPSAVPPTRSTWPSATRITDVPVPSEISR